MIIENGVYYAKAAAFLGAALAMGFGGIGPALGQGLVGMKACENIGKYPASAGDIRMTMMIAMGIVEAAAIYSVMIAGALIYVGYSLGS